ncbi:sugar phosphate isomerase/epimerase family protein [Pararhodonellum marinum]|uniref:sugar phosphate isomerase/epimerase family protein n=1 Tax=Pararhodonellum marinum TaxID=2755358 RepID=UPI00188EBDC1|nr:sugar phosphate isomerase/epimerase [Pararhodonellum marinum]
MKNRREFLKLGGLLTLGSLTGAADLFAYSNPIMEKMIGLQLYSLRKDMAKEPKKMLEKVAEIGFKTLETADYKDGKIYDMSPSDFRALTSDLGMRLTSAHLGGPNYNQTRNGEALDWWKKAIEDHVEAGLNFIIKPSMPKPKTLKELDGWCEYFNNIGLLSKASDIKFGFHNHAGEFVKIEDEIMYDYMLNHTDPDLVCYEMDVYWVTKGGHNPVDYLEKYPGRFPLLHIKDEKELGESGLMDYGPIFEAAYKQGMRDFYVEVERYNYEPIESVAKSFNYLHQAAYVK